MLQPIHGEKRSLLTTAFSIGYWLFFGMSAMVLYGGAVLLWLLTWPFDPTRRLLHRYTCWWSTLYLRCLPGCRLVVTGREKIVPGVPYVIVANHQSLTDIMALAALAVPFKWVSKREVFRWPCIGWNMSLNQYVAVDRGNVRTLRRTMAESKAWLQLGVSLLMFPEGTRSRTGLLQPFHHGPFKLAAECGCAVLPVVVDGTLPIYRGWRVSACPGTVLVRVLDPVAVEDAGGKVSELAELVFQRMQQELAAIRGPGSGASTAGMPEREQSHGA